MAAEGESMDCPSSFDYLDGEFLAVLLGVVTLMGSAISYFWHRRIERREEKEADKRAEHELDRQQALERVRKQLSVYIGPLHRLYKTHNTIIQQYRLSTGKDASHMIQSIQRKGRASWVQSFIVTDLQPYIDDPMSLEAKHYRGFISRRLKPVYTRIRELVLSHASDLADMPTHEEWLQKHSQETARSPYTGSVNVNVMFDTFTAWTFEFDDIIQSWDEGDFSRMQPSTEVAWVICNDIVDTLYDEAKLKEASYNKHVKVHQNKVNPSLTSELMESIFNSKTDFQEKPTGRRKSTVERMFARGEAAMNMESP